jgi:PilZ domain
MEYRAFLKKNMKTAAGKSPNSANSLVDKRRCDRYRFSTPISVSGNDASIISGITLEISEAGLSAVLASPLRIGDTVKLYPVVADTVTAQVRHNVGKIYGFQFLGMTNGQLGKLREMCRTLPRYPAKSKIGI